MRKEVDNLKVMNTSPNQLSPNIRNQLSPHYPLSKAKSSSNLLPQAPNINRQNSIKTTKLKVIVNVID